MIFFLIVRRARESAPVPVSELPTKEVRGVGRGSDAAHFKKTRGTLTTIHVRQV